MRPTLTPTVMNVTSSTHYRLFLVTAPNEIAGKYIARVDGFPCNALTPTGRCGLVSGHNGPCWDYLPELIESEGPWAVLKP